MAEDDDDEDDGDDGDDGDDCSWCWLFEGTQRTLEGTQRALRRHAHGTSKALKRFVEDTKVLRRHSKSSSNKHKTQDRNSKPAAATRSQIQLLEKKLNAHQ